MSEFLESWLSQRNKRSVTSRRSANTPESTSHESYAVEPKLVQQEDTGMDSEIPAQWDESRPVLATPDRNYFVGRAGSIRVWVVVANPSSAARKRLLHEVRIMRNIPPDKHIQQLFYSSGEDESTLYMTLKLVHPVGYDLDCLKNRFAFTGLCVPSTMVATIFRQLVNALNHLHTHGVLHRRLITKSVLIDLKNCVTLADMSDACLIGAVNYIKLGHVAPEVYEGGVPQGTEVDCWGLGVLIHQIYQGSCDILERGLNGKLTAVLAERHAMPGDAHRVMANLLAVERDERWTLEELCFSTWLRVCDVTAKAMTRLPPPQEQGRQYLRKFRSSGRPPAALAVRIGRKDHPHIVGKKLKDLRFSACNVTVLLVAMGEGTFTTQPGADTIIESGSWVYFGVASTRSTSNAFSKLVEHLKPPPEPPKVKATRTPREVITDKVQEFKHLVISRSLTYVKQKEFEDSTPSRLAELELEFDCFSFPEHIGEAAVIGHCPPVSMPDCPALDIRATLGLNLAGIKRPEQEDVEWFPGPQALVRPADLGLIVREPDMSGGSRPTLTDDRLQTLMDPPTFFREVNSNSMSLATNPSRPSRLPLGSRSPAAAVPTSMPDENSETATTHSDHDMCHEKSCRPLRPDLLDTDYLECHEPTSRPLRPDLPSPTFMLEENTEVKADDEVPKAEGLSELCGPNKAIPEFAFGPKSGKPGFTKSPGNGASELPSFFPALVMPWQSSREEVKKPQEHQDFIQPQVPKKTKETLSFRRSHGLYEEEEPSFEGIDNHFLVPNGEIKVPKSIRGFYEDEEPLTTTGGMVGIPHSGNLAHKANVFRGVYEDA